MTKELFAVKYYLYSIKNELRRDEFMHKKYGFEKEYETVIPRVEKIIIYALKFPKITFTLFKLLSQVWFYIPYNLLVFYKAFICFVKIKRNKGFIHVNKIAIAIYGFNFEHLKNAEFDGGVVYFDINKRKRIENDWKNSFYLYDYIDYKNIFFSIRHCLIVKEIFSKRDNSKSVYLQTYTAFDFFLLWSFLIRQLSTTQIQSIWFANDSDRWGLFFDRFPFKGERNILQHGLLFDFSKDMVGDRPTTPLPYRLRNINKIIVFDSNQYDAYRKLILANEKDVSFFNYPKCFEFSIWPKEDDSAKKILIIGQPQTQKYECELVKFILFHYPYTVIIRPHPLYSSQMYRQIKHLRYHINDNMSIYPKVDLVFYGADSTLVYLYFSKGADVKRLPINENSIVESLKFIK